MSILDELFNGQSPNGTSVPNSFNDFLVNSIGQGQANPVVNQTPNLDPTTFQARNGGFLGTGSSFRDILGHIGDALLIQGGHDPMYRNQQHARQIGDIVANSPNGMPDNTTVGKIMAIDPNIGDKFMQHSDNIAYRQALLGGRMNHWNAMDDKTRAQTENIYRTAAYRLLQTAKDQPTYDALKAQVADTLGNRGMDVSILGALPDKYDPDTLNRLGSDPSTWAKIDETSRHDQVMEPIAQQNADSNTTKAGAAVIGAKANTSRAATYAATAPVIAKAQADRTAKMQDHSGAPRPGGGGAPPLDAAAHKGKVANGPTGRWISDGRGWTKLP